MNFAAKVKETLFSTIDEMERYHWLFTKTPHTDFSRKKKWSFADMLKFMISMEGQSLKEELYKYFNYSITTPSNSSFNQRRSQILPEAFEFLFKEFTKKFVNDKNIYKGYRLIACDGSDLCIPRNPNDSTTYFQSLPNDKGFNQIHLNVFYDLCARQYIDGIIQPARNENEKRAMCDMIDRYDGNKKTIFIGDRGYENYNIFAHAEEKGVFYLIRAKDVDSTGILKALKLPKQNEFDIWCSIKLTRKQTKKIKADKEHYRFLPSTSTFDYLELRTDKLYELKMRIVRFPISENSYECIITNLSEKEFDADEVKALYSKRWGIETSFRELKYAIGVTQFHSKRLDYIQQEIWAKMILYNFCQIITAKGIVEQKKKRKYSYQLNYTRAIRICCYYLTLEKEKVPPDIESLIRQELLPVRTGRSDPRKVKPKSAISFLYRKA